MRGEAVLNYVLIVVIISHTLACLARGLSNQAQETERLRTLADRTWKAEQEAVIWSVFYLIIAWMLL